MTDSDNLQRARNIVADKFIAAELAKTEKPTNFPTFANWGHHIDDYSRFMREGAYDDDVAVQSTLEALNSSRA